MKELTLAACRNPNGLAIQLLKETLCRVLRFQKYADRDPEKSIIFILNPNPINLIF